MLAKNVIDSDILGKYFIWNISLSFFFFPLRKRLNRSLCPLNIILMLIVAISVEDKIETFICLHTF